MAEIAAEAPASVVMQGTPFYRGRPADLVPVAAGAAAVRRLTTKSTRPSSIKSTMCGVPSVTLFTSIVGTPRLLQGARRAARGEDRVAEAVQPLTEDGGRRLVGVADRYEDGALDGQARPRRRLALGEGHRRSRGDRHDLARRPHLRPQHGRQRREIAGRAHRLFDADVVGHRLCGEAELGQRGPASSWRRSLAIGTPVALLTKGTVREAAG